LGDDAGFGGHIENVGAHDLKSRKEARPAIQRRAFLIFAPLGEI
jgi:hypothetical protein